MQHGAREIGRPAGRPQNAPQAAGPEGRRLRGAGRRDRARSGVAVRTRQRMEHLWMAPAYLRIRRDYKRAKADGSFDEFFRIARRDNIQLREGQKSIDDIETEIERNGR